MRPTLHPDVMALLVLLTIFFQDGTLQAAWDKDPAPAARSPASGAWTPYPLWRKVPQGRTRLQLHVVGMPGSILEVFSPAPGQDSRFTPFTVPLDNNGAMVQPGNQVGNYHWLAAHTETPAESTTLTTVHHFAIPGPSPAHLLQAHKSTLEVIPVPLPREYATYRAGERWSFLVRFAQQPLAAQTVTLYTPGQEKISFTTNAAGVAQITFPPFRDMPRTDSDKKHGQRRPSVPFQVVTTLMQDNRRFTTIFQHDYGPEPLANRSQLHGLIFLLVGMGGGLTLWQRHAPGGGLPSRQRQPHRQRDKQS
ncbi:MAG: hypothetical protein HQL65_06940 [Magnetococcales bacterium]|nr:hypothetical protein [Magnetococcales bacterium]